METGPVVLPSYQNWNCSICMFFFHLSLVDSCYSSVPFIRVKQNQIIFSLTDDNKVSNCSFSSNP